VASGRAWARPTGSDFGAQPLAGGHDGTIAGRDLLSAIDLGAHLGFGSSLTNGSMIIDRR